ncbi:ParB/RepB/Spo0J family partition protein [Sphingomicrobium clamense]|uniref:ParB/RepB/Spo0J family partition protein n=1 Tax=Sphingomicrobium clamense TaxID=2851013 RepID=A0ABS6V322_9SPHN|nr:ParB/RepB/Spo0J family partition protein [Sphingomicrobium sp. B8]MBW0143944.1 ParB/RepB/Spo0J family partition protein [Sphingomicrobium sp. B8]
MKKPSGLGKGLSALLDDAQARRQASGGEVEKSTGVDTIAIADIKPNPNQPRRHFDADALTELSESIARDGVLQPIIVRPVDGGYELIAGERRWRAAQQAQLHEIPALIRESDVEHSAELAIIENIQREDLNAIEEAAAYKALMDAYGHGPAQVGEIVGKSRSHVANLLRLLELPDEVQQMLLRGDISMGHARAAAGAEDPLALAKSIVSEGLSVRQAEQRAKAAKTPKNSGQSSSASGPADADLAALQRQLGDMLGLRVRVLHGQKGGKVELSYRTLDQLDMICQRLSGEPI